MNFLLLILTNILLGNNENCYQLLVGVQISTKTWENTLVLFSKMERTHILQLINLFFKYVLEKFLLMCTRRNQQGCLEQHVRNYKTSSQGSVSIE